MALEHMDINGYIEVIIGMSDNIYLFSFLMDAERGMGGISI
jgi:hypothetical protein